ncbi:MAG: PAS domain-containing protein [Deltaproteobacteria bacterium]|mgnify:CR=1 FL=1|nr:PAS domain-containing protein [Deltaproteobacteria bacterium]
MDEKEYVFDLLKRVADGVVRTFERNCEVAIHDLANLPHSLIYIAGNVTKRNIGAPITDLVLQALHEQGKNVKDMYNYRTTTSDGRALKSTSIFFRDRNGEVIGTLCINFDTTDYVNASLALEPLITTGNLADQGKSETFASSVEETIEAIFRQTVSEVGKGPATMSTEEKIKCVEQLERKGTFLIKGAVDQVAMMLGISKYTVYSYLQKVRAAHAVNKI